MSGAPPLPQGWEAKTSPDPAHNGAIYYVNMHNPAHTQWEYPTAPAPQAMQSGAPGPAVVPQAQGGMMANDPLSNALNLNNDPIHWMATPQVDCEVPGLEKLTQVKSLYVVQDIQAMEALSGGCCEFNNRYKVINQDGQLVYAVTEESDACCRCCCAPVHTMTLDFTDEQNRKVMSMYRPFKIPPCCPVCIEACQQQATIQRGSPLNVSGMLYQPQFGGGFVPTIEMYEGTQIDAEGNVTEKGQLQGVIEGPKCCIGGFCESSFNMREPAEGSQPFAQITKQGADSFTAAMREALTDADKFKMEFNDGVSVPMKANAMAGNMLLDYMFFEGDGLFDCGMTDQGGTYCSIKLCDLYCYGCIWPCAIRCENNPGDG